jgi:putative oxidoreductase
MSIFESSPYAGRMLSVVRIVAGLIFLSYGSMKLFHYPPGMPGPVSLLSLIGAAGILEFFGGIGIAMGLLTRPLAFLLSGEMAVAYFRVHFPKSFFPVVNGGVPAVLFCFFFLYLAFAGAGEWSVDAALARRDQAQH